MSLRPRQRPCFWPVGGGRGRWRVVELDVCRWPGSSLLHRSACRNGGGEAGRVVIGLPAHGIFSVSQFEQGIPLRLPCSNCLSSRKCHSPACWPQGLDNLYGFYFIHPGAPLRQFRKKDTCVLLTSRPPRRFLPEHGSLTKANRPFHTH